MSYPEEIELTLKLRIKVSNEEDKNYYLVPETGAATYDVIADIFDMIQSDNLLAVDNVTLPELREIVQARVESSR